MLKNVLEKDPSPYLQQHKDNPVNWQVWSEEILLIAKKEKKSIYFHTEHGGCMEDLAQFDSRTIKSDCFLSWNYSNKKNSFQISSDMFMFFARTYRFCFSIL